MVTKVTLRLPDHLAKELRERGKLQGHSLNTVAITALARGLEQAPEDEPDDWWHTLGDLLERPPLAKFDPEALARLQATLPKTDTSIDETLSWLRQDRDL
jgi:hypothetical protein